MGMPAARQGDPVMGTDTHIVMVPSAGGPVPTPLPHPFSGALVDGLRADVLIDGRPAAVEGSVARNNPPHVPTAPGTSFQNPPRNAGSVETGSTTVRIGGTPAARQGDAVRTCNDPADAPTATITAGSPRVHIG